MDFKGATIFICYRRISVIAHIENLENLVKGLKTASIIGVYPLLASPLKRYSTVLTFDAISNLRS